MPRATFDLDILVKAEEENIKKLLTALEEAGMGTASLTNVKDVLSNEITVFEDKVRLDIQTKTPGINFSEAWEKRQKLEWEGATILFVSKEHLIASKKASARPIDLEDVSLLEE